MAREKIILLPIDIHWGEIDWILPVIQMLRKLRPDCKIVAAFKSRELYDKKESQQTLYRELLDVTDDIVYPDFTSSIGRSWSNLTTGLYARGLMHYLDQAIQKIKKTPQGTFPTASLLNLDYIFKDKYEPQDVVLIMKDYANDTRFDRALERRCPNAKIVVYPHATSIFIFQESNQKINPEYYRGQHSHDLFLVSTKMSADWWREQHCQEGCLPIGFPRLDRWWTEHLIEDDNFLQSDDYKFAKSAEKVFTYITRHPAGNMLDINDMEYLLKTAAEQVLSYEGAVLIYKPHPNQDINHLKEMIKDYDQSRIRISAHSAIQLFSVTDMVLSMHSSCIMDALSIDKPVIEYFRYLESPDAYAARNDGYLFCDDSKLGSPHRYLKLVAAADTQAELAELIEDYFSEKPTNSIWQQQKNRFRAICPDSYDGATRAACDAILKLLENHEQ